MEIYRNMRSCIRLGLAVMMVMAGIQTADAQRMIRVSGTVFNTADTKKITPVTDTEVIVYSCKTVAQGRKLQKELNNKEIAVILDEENTTRIDKNGYYEILVPDNGALVFKTAMTEAVMVSVNNNQRIDVNMDLGLQLEEVVVTGMRTELQPEPSIGGLNGNMFIVGNTFVLPQMMGNEYARMVIQPYTMTCGKDGNDTIGFSEPIVIDGKKFRSAQVRKMGYDLSRDPLEKYVWKNYELTGDKMEIVWKDTIIVSDPEANYSCYADFIVENLNAVGYDRVFQIVSCKNKRPLQFLEYTNTYKKMDFNSPFNVERPKVEKRNTRDRVQLTFRISSDKLVETEENMQNMNRIKMNLQNILNVPDATLKELYITGYASPEGSYRMNMNLAGKRTRRIMNEVTEILPESVNEMMYKMYEAEVKPWKEVADMMREDSLTTMPEELENIIERYDGNTDRQSMEIRKLKYYKDTVVEYLERLRQVEYRIVYDIYREPTDEEVMEAYRRNGLKGVYTRYEYWKLFQMIEDDAELEKLARKAYNESMEESPERPWALAANVLAVQYLKRDTADTSILEPFIDKSVYVTDYQRTNVNTNRTELVNPKEIVNNQLCMYIKKYDYRNASILAKILPDEEEFRMAKAFAWALGGYYKGGRNDEEKRRCETTFNDISKSTKRNAVVMCLALETEKGNKMAAKAIGELNQEEAMTWYFKAIVNARKGDAGFTDTMMCLYQCFMADRSFIHTAENDGEFTDETVKAAVDMLMINGTDRQ